MTTSQRSGFYFPVWAKCARALGWSSRPPAARLPSHGHGLANDLYQAVYDAADRIAVGALRAVKAEDLRHACNFVASADLKAKSDALLASRKPHEKQQGIPGARGARMSATGFTTAETNHVVTLFRLLAEPDKIQWHLDWNFPEDMNRRSILAALLQRADEAYAEWIARCRFGAPLEAEPSDITPPKEKLLAEWKDLPMEQLRDLLAIVVQRDRARQKKILKGICRECGCTDQDCSGCIQRTGEACSWTDRDHTLCSACVKLPAVPALTQQLI